MTNVSSPPRVRAAQVTASAPGPAAIFQGYNSVFGNGLSTAVTGETVSRGANSKVKYDQLVDAGKPAKVAITAIMRKLIVMANALLKAGRPWMPKTV